MKINQSRRKKLFTSIAVQILFVVTGLGIIHCLKQVSPNRDDAKLEQIKLELAEIPVYSSFQKVDERYSSRYMDARASISFRSGAGIGDVRAFYDRELSKLGWEIKASGDSFYYQKNDLQLSIEYRPGQSDWNFGLGIDWKNPANYP